jgi:phosphoribosylformimino-5-aminoimidazole carboxamide ribotide isomerase
LLIYPAIDLYEGRVVRLARGEYGDMTLYSDDPVAVARGFAEAGADFVHVVDLEGARNGAMPNFETLRAIVECVPRVQTGGGVRSAQAVKRCLDAGVARVVLGTAAITTPGFVREMTAAYGEAIAVGADIKDGLVAIEGWTKLSDRRALDFCLDMEAAGVGAIICTDVSKDGLMAGANTALYRELSERLSVKLIASGGVTSMEDVAALRDMGLHGAIVGKTLYEGKLDLAAAIKTAAEERAV